MARRSINAAAALMDGFAQGYQTTGRVLRDIDVAKLAALKPEAVQTAIDPAAAGADPLATAPSKVSFMGKEYGSADDPGISRARQLAMAGVLEKYGDVEGGQSLRERIAAQALNEERAGRERELYPLQLEQAKLGVTGAQRNDRMGARAEKSALDTDALNKDVGEWMKGRLVGPDGKARAASPDDYLAAAQYRAGKLFEAGKADEANKAMQEYHAAASGKIALDSAQRTEAIGKTIAALGAGDINAVGDFYNRFVPDGSKVTGVKRGANGEITIQRQTEDGKPLAPTVLKDVNQVAATLASFKDPMALYQWSQGEFQRTMAQRQLAVSQGHLGIAAAAARRAEEDHAALGPERQARGEAGKLRIELANVDETTPDGKKRADQIQSKLQALATGTKGGGAGHDPADVAKARWLVTAGTYPDLSTALDGVVNKPDQMHKEFVNQGLKNMMKPADAVKAADETMSTMGWNRNGSRWTKAGGSTGGAAGAPKKGDVIDGYTFNGGDPKDQKNWTKK